MGFQHVVIGMNWERGQYKVAFSRTISLPRGENLKFLDVEISKGYSDKVSVLGPDQLDRIISSDDDRQALLDLKPSATFFLLHRIEL